MIARRPVTIQTATPNVMVQDAIRVAKHEDYILDMTYSMKNYISVFVLIVACLVLGYGFKALNTQMGYQVVKMQENVVSLTKSNEMLRLDTAELKAPGRIQTIAEKELGMVMPNEFVYSSERASSIQTKSIKVRPIID